MNSCTTSISLFASTPSLQAGRQHSSVAAALPRAAVLPKCRQQARSAPCCLAGSRQKVQDHDNPLALAFLGDAIWTLYVRRHFLHPPKHHRLYHSAVKPFITAEGQAAVYDSLLSGQQLSAEEAAFLRRVAAWEGVKLRKRFSTAAAADTYRKATALEALVGQLYLHHPQRLTALVDTLLPPVTPVTPVTPATPVIPGGSRAPTPEQTQDVEDARK